MDLVKLYGSVIAKNIKHPRRAFKLLKGGYKLEYLKLSKLPDNKVPLSHQYLSKICMQYILEPLCNPERSVFVNLFAPSEFLHAMEVYPLFVEAFASFLTGTKCEDAFIESAEEAGIPETLCSYHKAFLGAVEAGILPSPRFIITTSLACDANINTFRHIASKYNIECYVIDVPYEYSKEAEEYVALQLKEMVSFIEDNMSERLDEERLRTVILNEKNSWHLQKEFVYELAHKYFPNTLTTEMYELFTTHVAMGRDETLKYYRMLYEDIKKYSIKVDAIRILWVHVIPFYNELLMRYFDNSKRYQLLMTDLTFDYLEEVDCNKPYNTIARKIILNSLNGPYERRVENILRMARKTNADAVISFNHWGCKQSCGGSMILRKVLEEEGIPVLTIEGDGVDSRNSHTGQLRTRLEAFFEILENRKGGKAV